MRLPQILVHNSEIRILVCLAWADSFCCFVAVGIMTSSRNVIVTVIRIAFALISFFASGLNLVLIKSMGKWNGYLAIIWYVNVLFAVNCLLITLIRTMEVCQLFYDASFIFADAYKFKAFWIGIQIFGGLSVSIWTNILSIVLLNVVVNTRAVDIIKWFYHFLAISILPCILLGALYISFNKHDVTDRRIFGLYFILRATSIAINFGTFALITFRANMMQSQTTSVRTSAEAAIRVLSRRVVYYPVLQAITIIPSIVYEKYYGVSNGIDVQTEDQFSAAIVYLVVSPSAGLGYLIIFLIMQPNAYKHFVIMINQTLAFLNCCCPKPVDEDKKVVVFGVIDNSITTGSNKPPERLSGRLANFFHIGGPTQPVAINNNGSAANAQMSDDMVARTPEEQAEFLYGQFRNMEEDDLIKEIYKRTESSTSVTSVVSNIHLHVDPPVTTRGSLELERDSGFSNGVGRRTNSA